MSDVREIVTLQFGNYANQIGTHWWNIQESGFSYSVREAEQEICHDVLYREGKTLTRQTTYTPRLLLVDLDGAQKHVPIQGELYSRKRIIRGEKKVDDDDDNPLKKLKDELQLDDDDIEIREEPEVRKNEFQSDLDDPEINYEEKEYNLANTAETWADFLYARYHPRTVNIIKECKFDPQKQTLDTFTAGSLIWKTDQFQDEFCDKIRQYVEECDYLQGFHSIFDAFNGFSGMAIPCIEHLSDEYAKAVLAVPVYSPRNILIENADEAVTNSTRVVNSALAFNGLIEYSSMFVPLSTRSSVWRDLSSQRLLSSVNYKDDNLYQTSAILAAYLDTISLRYRLKKAPPTNTLPGLCSDLTNFNRKLTGAALALPFPMKCDVDLIDWLDKFESKLYTQLTPNCNINNDYLIQSICVRGIPNNRLKRPLEQAKLQMRMTAYRCNNVSEMFQLYLQCANPASMAHVSSVSSGMPTRCPFPREIFDDTLNADGFLLPGKRISSERITSVPVLASMQASSGLGDTLDKLYIEGRRLRLQKLNNFVAKGIEYDDYSEALENIRLFQDNYDDHFVL